MTYSNCWLNMTESVIKSGRMDGHVSPWYIAKILCVVEFLWPTSQTICSPLKATKFESIKCPRVQNKYEMQANENNVTLKNFWKKSWKTFLTKQFSYGWIVIY